MLVPFLLLFQSFSLSSFSIHLHIKSIRLARCGRQRKYLLNVCKFVSMLAILYLQSVQHDSGGIIFYVFSLSNFG